MAIANRRQAPVRQALYPRHVTEGRRLLIEATSDALHDRWDGLQAAVTAGDWPTVRDLARAMRRTVASVRRVAADPSLFETLDQSAADMERLAEIRLRNYAP